MKLVLHLSPAGVSTVDSEDQSVQRERPQVLQDGLFCSTLGSALDDRRCRVCLCCDQDKSLDKLFVTDYPDFESHPITRNHRCVVFHSHTFAERGFTTEEEADSWLQQAPTWPLWMIYRNVTNEDRGWRGFIPVVSRSHGLSAKFTGPYIKDLPAPADYDGDGLIRIELQNILGENNFNPTLEAADSLGLTFPLTREQLRLVRKRSAEFSIPEIECRLNDDWGFQRILREVRNRPYHGATITASCFLKHLQSATVEFEASLLKVLPDVSVADVYNVLTSLQFHAHLTGVATKIESLYLGAGTHVALANIFRWIGSYVAQFRRAHAETSQTSEDPTTEGIVARAVVRPQVEKDVPASAASDGPGPSTVDRAAPQGQRSLGANNPHRLSKRDADIHDAIGTTNFRHLTNAEILRRHRQLLQKASSDAKKSCLDRIRHANGYPLSSEIAKKNRSTRP